MVVFPFVFTYFQCPSALAVIVGISCTLHHWLFLLMLTGLILHFLSMACVALHGLSESHSSSVSNYGHPHLTSHRQQVPPYFHSLVVIPVAVTIVVIAIACASAYMYVKFEERKTALLKAGVDHIIANSPSRNFQYISGSSIGTSSLSGSRATSIVSEEGTLTLRYSDSSGRPLLARPPVPTVLWAQQQGPIMEESESESYSSPSYTTMPLKRFTTFNPSPEHPPPRLPPDLLVSRRMSCGNGVGGVGGISPPSSQQQRNSFVNVRTNEMVVGGCTGNSAVAGGNGGNASNLFCKVDVHFEDTSSSSSMLLPASSTTMNGGDRN